MDSPFFHKNKILYYQPQSLKMQLLPVNTDLNKTHNLQIDTYMNPHIFTPHSRKRTFKQNLQSVYLHNTHTKWKNEATVTITMGGGLV